MKVDIPNPLLLSIVIPTHNRRVKLTRLIDSIMTSTMPVRDYEIIVVADRCVDDTVSVLQERYPHVQCIASLEPLLSTRARTLGATHARGRYIFFIDDDNVVDPQCLVTLVNAMERYPHVGILGPLMLRYPEGSGIWCAGAVIKRSGMVDHRNHGPLPIDTAYPDLSTPCDFLPNAFLVQKTLLFQDFPMDPNTFPHNWMEPDIGLHAQRAGYDVRVALQSKVWHDSGYSGYTTRVMLPFIADQARGRILIRRRYPEVFASRLYFWCVFWPISTVYYLVRFLRDRDLSFRSALREYFRGTWYGIKQDISFPMNKCTTIRTTSTSEPPSTSR